MIERILEKVNALFRLANDKGASKTEKENAIKAAQKLISRYQLDNLVTRKNSTDDYSEVVIFNDNNKNRITWKEKLIYGICHVNGCEMILRKSSVPNTMRVAKKWQRDPSYYYYTCFGRQENTKLCKQLLDLIIPQIEFLAKENKKLYEESIGIRKRGPSGESFKLGCVKIIIDKLNEARDDEINSYVREGSKNNKTDNTDEVANALVLVVIDFKKELERSQEILQDRIRTACGNPKRSSLKDKSNRIKSSDYERGIEAGNNVNINLLKMLK